MRRAAILCLIIRKLPISSPEPTIHLVSTKILVLTKWIVGSGDEIGNFLIIKHKMAARRMPKHVFKSYFVVFLNLRFLV